MQDINITKITGYVFCASLSLFMFGAYKKSNLLSPKSALICILLSHLFLVLLLPTFFYNFQSSLIWTEIPLISTLLSFTLIATLHTYYSRTMFFQKLKKTILIVGTGKKAQKIKKLVNENKLPTINLQGFITFDSNKASPEPQESIVWNKNLLGLVDLLNTDEIVVALEGNLTQSQINELIRCRMNGIEIIDAPQFIEKHLGYISLGSFDPKHHILEKSTRFFSLDLFLKRTFDVFLAFTALLICLPLLFVCLVAVFLESRASPFLQQERIGLWGRHFTLWKIRTMRVDAEYKEGPQWCQERDSRITFVGRILRRHRIDEIPQLLNVLKGDMSIVGPRPERPEFVRLLEKEIPNYTLRMSLKPGITGWAQINYPYAANLTQTRRKLEYDLYYIKNYNFVLDLLIILQTLRVMLWPYVEETAVGLGDANSIYPIFLSQTTYND